MLDALRCAAAFIGVRLGACVAMDNHFHAVVRVEAPDAPSGAIGYSTHGWRFAKVGA